MGKSATGDLDVDLTGAELSDFNFAGCRIRSALFGGATFTGEARFDIAVFRGDAIFDAAVFADGAFFERATSLRSASFKGTDFDEPPPLEAEFTGDPGFTEATFHGNCIFSGQPVPGGFSRAKLSKQVVFYPPADLQLPLPSSGNEWFVMPYPRTALSRSPLWRMPIRHRKPHLLTLCRTLPEMECSGDLTDSGGRFSAFRSLSPLGGST